MACYSNETYTDVTKTTKAAITNASKTITHTSARTQNYYRSQMVEIVCHCNSRHTVKMAKKKKALGSLRDQLKDAGLVTAKQVKKAERGALRNELRIKKGIEVDEIKLEVEAARVKKLEADKQKNNELNQLSKEKELLAQVKQLIESNSQRQDGEITYNFTDQNKIKNIYISAENKFQLNKGYLAIVKSGELYDLVPEVVAVKIKARSAESVLFLHDRSDDVIDEDDPYKDYQIPDDLEW